eukprot:TRINITY_DN1161_c3_g1_i1.p1 TRINITY_DN1161_c3_g1~~TRINITY_DN1161_c3_g1_i1.p1  ORF type:complete len:226 (+),score=67.19 TRINITY_DN1161_c3_g1_i1:27-680(+)
MSALRMERERIEAQRARNMKRAAERRAQILKEQQETEARLAKMQRDIKAESQRQVEAMAAARARRERRAALELELEEKKKSSATPSKRAIRTPKKTPQQSKSRPLRPSKEDNDLNFSLDTGASFKAANYLDKILLREYINRSVLNEALPEVKFSKQMAGQYAIGQRRFRAKVVDGQAYVDLGRQQVRFVDWIEKAEKTEALKLKGLRSALTLVPLLR